MVGIPAIEPKKRGRPSHTDKEIEEIGRTIEILQEFENLEEPGKKTLQKQNYDFAAKSKALKSENMIVAGQAIPLKLFEACIISIKKKAFKNA